MIRAHLLGTGAGKADAERYSPSNAVWLGEQPVLIDCGSGCLVRLRQIGVFPADIHELFLTHLHYDHYADYPYLMMEPLIGEAAFARGPLTVYGPPGTERLVRDFERTYDIEMDSYAVLEGYERIRECAHATVREVHHGWSLERNGWRIIAGKVDHGDVPIASFGYRIESPAGESFVLSGDTIECDGIVELAKGADLLLHECTLPESELDLRRSHGYAWRIHSTPTQAGRVARRAGVNKLVLNHFAAWNSFSPERERYDWETIAPAGVGLEYGGPVTVGHDLLEITVG